MAPRAKKTDPRIVKLPSEKMAVVVTHGEPCQELIEPAMKALYGSVYTLKFDRKKKDPGKDFKLGKPRSRWPDSKDKPRDEWTGMWAIPVPKTVRKVPQKQPGVEVTLQKWEYGTCAEILHIGPYDKMVPSIEKLEAFIDEQGYQITGPHEEEYLTGPNAREIRTIIRFEVRKKK